MEGRRLWIQDGDVDGRIEPGNVVRATRTLSDWCLRGDHGSSPVAPGTRLKVVDMRPWGAAEAVEVIGVNATDEAPAVSIGIDPDRAAQIKRMARLEQLIAADEWDAYQELRELGSPAARLRQPGLPGAVGVRQRVAQLLTGAAPRFAAS